MLYRPAGLWPSPIKEDRPSAAHAKEAHEENEANEAEKTGAQP
jgi:branched-chain amino acid transport system permease protein